jgi:hypothetical protein
MRGRVSGAVSISLTELSDSDAVLAKSTSRRGVQWALPPPTTAIRGILVLLLVSAMLDGTA